MTYPASPNDARTNRVRLDSAQFWAGSVATAAVAALTALAGILACRWALNIPVLAPAGDGAWGNAHTAEYVILAALIALVAAGVRYLLALGTRQPRMFFDWIMGLSTIVAAVYPFSTSAPLNQKGATAVVGLLLGIAITSLLAAVAVRSLRLPVPPRYPAAPDYRAGRGYRAAQGYVPAQRAHEPAQPLSVPHPREPLRWE